MVELDFEYWGLMAQTWDLFRGDTSKWADRFFYREAIQDYTHAQAVQLYQDAGFEPVEVYRDFIWEAADPEDRVVSIVGRK